MVKKFLALGLLGIFLCLVSTTAYSADEDTLCPQVANYTIDVKLDTAAKSITGKEILNWTNTTQSTADELWFHLYWNAFQNNQSTFLSEGEGRRGGEKGFKREDWGYIRVDGIKIIPSEAFEEAELTPTLEFRHPDNDNILDQTVFSVKLPQPVLPGQAVSLRIDFHSKVPRPISRTGVYKDYYFIAQWFPKIGVLQDAGWNCHQFHSTSEFFADYGTYDVRITLPSSFIVGATGEHSDNIDNGDGTATHRFIQHSVHDFAWTASPRFLQFTEDFEFAPGKIIEITILLQPEHKKLKDRYMAAVKNAIKYSSLFFGDYPYSTATCVDPAYNSRSGGMEYPTFFTGGAYFIAREGISRPEGVTIHEFGHGYFYGLVGSNEFENPWMDEGFTSFLDSMIYYTSYGNPVFSKMYFGIPITFKSIEIPIESSGISRHRMTSDMDDMQRFAWKFMNNDSYGANSYAKAELMLRTLQRFMGKELFGQMIKAYSQRFWFKHPKPQDFIACVSEFAGQDMHWMCDQFIFGSGKLDYAVGSVVSKRPEPKKGWFDQEYKGEFEKDKKGIVSEKPLYESEVLVRRLGEVKVPVEVLIIFEDGEKIRESWDGQYRWKKFIFKRPSKIESAIVDPDFKLVIDVNRTNNSMMRKSNRLAPLKWTSQWLVWLQHFFEVFTLFGS